MVQYPHGDGGGERPYGLPVMSTADALGVCQASCNADAQYLLTLRKKRLKALARQVSLLGLPAHATTKPGG